MSAANLFTLEEQAAAASAGEWSARKRDRRRRSVVAELAELGPKLERAESDMRRAFARWSKLRERDARLHRELVRLMAELDALPHPGAGP